MNRHTDVRKPLELISPSIQAPPSKPEDETKAVQAETCSPHTIPELLESDPSQKSYKSLVTPCAGEEGLQQAVLPRRLQPMCPRPARCRLRSSVFGVYRFIGNRQTLHSWLSLELFLYTPFLQEDRPFRRQLRLERFEALGLLGIALLRL